MTRYGMPFGKAPVSWMRTMCSLSIFDAATASLTNRWTAPGTITIAGLMNLSATVARRTRCVARATAPIAPSPRSPSIRYLPSTTSPMAGYPPNAAPGLPGRSAESVISPAPFAGHYQIILNAHGQVY